MALIGIIRRDADPLGVDLTRWRKLIKSSPHIRSAPPRDIVNPFTGQPIAFLPPDTEGILHHCGAAVGTISASDAIEGELDVWLNESCEGRKIVERIAQSVANELGAKYFTIPDDPSPHD